MGKNAVIVWRDGELIEAERAISAADRGYLVGDAVFETLLVRGGKPAFLDAHLARLSRGCRTLKMAASIDADFVRATIAALAERNGVAGRGACRLTVSRVGGRRGLAPSDDARVQIVIALAPAGEPPAFMNLVVSEKIRWSRASTNAFKCAGAYAENLLARSEAAKRDADEAVMMNEYGRVACASAANIFVVSSKGVATPALCEGAMPGVVREIILEEARGLGIAAQEAPIEVSALSATLLVTNSLVGAVKSALDGARAPAEREMTQALIDGYERRLAREFEKEAMA